MIFHINYSPLSGVFIKIKLVIVENFDSLNRYRYRGSEIENQTKNFNKEYEIVFHESSYKAKKQKKFKEIF